MEGAQQAQASAGEQQEAWMYPRYVASLNTSMSLNVSSVSSLSLVPMAASVSASPLEMSMEPSAEDLQRRLSSMEATVQSQLQVLDSLFPGIKPDLSADTDLPLMHANDNSLLLAQLNCNLNL